ncbi:hypothetical protein BC941DRAFT_121015 [Chlamydoabsidia padenii]|nr:hypothetical protein BC941DRAFT_121015 [Chlamydoabsidia padenii]
MTTTETLVSSQKEPPCSPSFSVATLSTEGGSPGPECIVDDVELLSILASTNDKNHAIHADLNSDIKTPTMAFLDWNDWSDDKKRKRDDNEDEFNFLDQFDFVDVSFDDFACKKQKTFVNENVDDLTNLLNQSDSLMADLDYRWVLDITS